MNLHISSYLKNEIKRITKRLQKLLSTEQQTKNNLYDPHQHSEIVIDPAGSKHHNQKIIIEESLSLQLELIRKTLNLTTAAIIIVSNNDDQMFLHSISTCRDDIFAGPYPKGTGITGAIFRGQEEVALNNININYSGLPYYNSIGDTGGIIALQLPSFNLRDRNSEEFTLIFCADRVSSEKWQEEELDILRLNARKLSMEIHLSRHFDTLDHEHDIIQKICSCFEELNRGLGLESVFNATAKAVNEFVDVDFISVSLVREMTHYTAFIVSSKDEEHFLGMEYDLNEGIIGQVLKHNHSLPANASYNGAAPVFSREHTLEGYNSLFIIPLSPEEGDPLGALTVAAKESGIFDSNRQRILSFVAGHVAIKIDLAKSHEKINKMATTDGLTNLDNHRTFQHGFDIMLHRAKRRKSPLTLIFCDIDFFKKVNDNYGHQFGDKILKSVSQILLSAVRKEDLAARYGGEEFALILENSTKNGALQMAERIRMDIAALTFDYKGEKIGFTISLGISSFPEDASEKLLIIEQADKALYAAKNKGRNQTVLWSSDLEVQ